MIRVLLVDDDALVRSGLRMMLAGAANLDVVAEAADGREVLGAVDLHRPDVVLMDIRMPELDGIAATRLLAAQPDVDVERIAVVGGSYGGYLATLLTRERDVRALGLRAPALYKDDDFDRPKRQLNLDPDLPAYRRRRLEPSDNIALAAAARFEGDVLIVESEHDTVIPHPVIANYVRAFGGAASVEHEILRDADHGLSHKTWRRAWGDLLVRWVTARLPVATAVRAARTA